MLIQVSKLSAVERLMNAKRSIKDNSSRGKLLLRDLGRVEVWRDGEIHCSEVDFENAN